MKAFLPLFAVAAATSLAFTQASPPLESASQEPAAPPRSLTGNAPPEAQLSPPPDTEKSLVPPGYMQVFNPAFPGEPPRRLPWPLPSPSAAPTAWRTSPRTSPRARSRWPRRPSTRASTPAPASCSRRRETLRPCATCAP
ncbi:hypothetical protein ACN28S_16790 [Cystobacter fuscus]